jgi:hypothetical protein
MQAPAIPGTPPTHIGPWSSRWWLPGPNRKWTQPSRRVQPPGGRVHFGLVALDDPVELRYDPAERETHLADGTGFLCDTLRPGYDRWRGKRGVSQTRAGQFREVECPHCWRMYEQRQR